MGGIRAEVQLCAENVRHVWMWFTLCSDVRRNKKRIWSRLKKLGFAHISLIYGKYVRRKPQKHTPESAVSTDNARILAHFRIPALMEKDMGRAGYDFQSPDNEKPRLERGTEPWVVPEGLRT